MEHGCTHYVQLLGNDPQTGEAVNNWLCVDLARITIALESSNEIRQLAAAIESFRNEMVGQKLIIDLQQLDLLNKGVKHVQNHDDQRNLSRGNGV